VTLSDSEYSVPSLPLMRCGVFAHAAATRTKQGCSFFD
jgi:hypothetical protein